MSIKEDLNKVQEKIGKIQETAKEIKSPSMELLIYANNRERNLMTIIKCLIILLIITFVGFCVSTAYLVYLLNDIETVTTTEHTSETIIEQDAETGNNNYIGGDNNGEITNN